MARPSKPWLRKGRGWYVEIHGRQEKLGHDKDEAHKEWHRLLAKPKPVVNDLVAGIVEGFLDWCKRNRSARTFEWYSDHLTSFCNSLVRPEEFPLSELKPHHVSAWADSHDGWGDSQKRGAMGAVQRAFNWAEKIGHIDRNPVRYIEGKPAQGRREQHITAKQFKQLVGEYETDDPFRHLLEFVWETGSRPQEAKEIEGRHYVRERKRIELPPSEAKGKKRWRVIYLTDKARKLVEKLVKKRPKGPLFRNADGKPWTAWATNNRLERLKDKIGYKASVYALRHSFCQRMLEAGLDVTTVAALMGHSNSQMVSTTYSHMNKAKDFLAEQLKIVG